jgi:hypothetical protein
MLVEQEFIELLHGLYATLWFNWIVLDNYTLRTSHLFYI